MASGIQMDKRAASLIELLKDLNIEYIFKTEYEELPDLHEIKIGNGSVRIYNTSPIAYQYIEETNFLDIGNIDDKYKFREEELNNLVKVISSKEKTK